MSVYVCGDLHGNAANIENVYNQIEKPTSNDTVIVIGDAGLEYGNHILGKAKKAMSKFPGKWIVMRGNHDTRYWRDHAMQRQGENWCTVGNYLVQKKYPNILYVKDEGGIYNISNLQILIAPGAYSVDKQYRLQYNLPYEAEEQLTYKEMYALYDEVKDFIDSGQKFDFVLSHTAPYSLQSHLEYLFLDCINQKEVDKTTEKWLDEILELIKNTGFKQWYFGHFHADKSFMNKFTMCYKIIHKIGD